MGCLAGEVYNCRPQEADLVDTCRAAPGGGQDRLHLRTARAGDGSTPTTTYTIANDVMVGFSIEPEEAGTLLPANDGKSVVVTWSNTYKGEVVLTATPTAECNNGIGTFDIKVKNSTDVNEYNINANLYPNPTNGNVTIEAEGMQRLTVVNELGQVVYDAEVNNDTETLNMSQFGVGVFMIRIYTENGVGVKRVSVIR